MAQIQDSPARRYISAAVATAKDRLERQNPKRLGTISPPLWRQYGQEVLIGKRTRSTTGGCWFDSGSALQNGTAGCGRPLSEHRRETSVQFRPVPPPDSLGVGVRLLCKIWRVCCFYSLGSRRERIAIAVKQTVSAGKPDKKKPQPKGCGNIQTGGNNNVGR